MQSSLVSIIVPCYNQAQYLPETLDSVLAQIYPNWECIIVNDGSPDNTEDIAKIYCAKDIRFTYIRKENGGLASARNYGIKISNGDFILPLDSDDKISDDYLDLAVRRFFDYPETKLVYCKAEFFGEVNDVWRLKEYNYETLLFENIIFCSSIFKRCDFMQTNGYNENFKTGLEDWDFLLSFLSPIDLVYKIPKICFYYRIRNNSMIKSMSIESFFLITRQIVINHREKYESYFPDILGFKELLKQQTEISRQQQETIDYLNVQLKQTRESNAFRIGKFILKPLFYIKNRLTK